MAHSTRHTYALQKRDIKEAITWFIGCHSHVQGLNGPIKIKDNDLQASREEISKFLGSSLLVSSNGHKLLMPKRTLYRYLQQLKKEGNVIQPKQSIYRLTEQGYKRWSLINMLYKAGLTLSTKEPVGTFFSLGPKERGQTQYVDIFVRVTEPELVKTIKKAIIENKVPENDKQLGKLLSIAINWYFKGTFQIIRNLIDGKEDALLNLIDKLPISDSEKKTSCLD
jgi:hypothetical protein